MLTERLKRVSFCWQSVVDLQITSRAYDYILSHESYSCFLGNFNPFCLPFWCRITFKIRLSQIYISTIKELQLECKFASEWFVALIKNMDWFLGFGRRLCSCFLGIEERSLQVQTVKFQKKFMQQGCLTSVSLFGLLKVSHILVVIECIPRFKVREKGV